MAVGLWQNYVEGIVTSSTQYIKYSNETRMKKILNSPEKRKKKKEYLNTLNIPEA